MSLQAKEMIRELKTLLSTLDGVSVICTQDTSNVLMIEFTVASPESRLLLIYCAEAANVKLNSWAKHRPGSNEAKSDPDRAVHYRYRSSNRSESELEALDEFEGLGAHLTWNMYRAGVISGEEEKRRSAMFNAVSKSTRR